MKTKVLSFLAVCCIALACIVYVSSCKKDKCKDVSCLNGGVCTDGLCSCVNGFSGDRCQVAPDPCANVTCQNGGTCINGVCGCESWYEGTNCETEMRAKFLRNNANTTELCGGTASLPYTVDILDGAYLNEIRIKNLGNYNCGPDYFVTGTLTSSTSFSIYSQTDCGIYFTGNGSILNGHVSVSYNASATGVNDNCTAQIQ